MYHYFGWWRDDGTDVTVHDLLRCQTREKAGRAEDPSAATALPAASAAAAATPQCTLTIGAAYPPYQDYFLLHVGCTEGNVVSFSVHGSDLWDDDWLFTQRDGYEIIVDGGKLNEDPGAGDEIYAKATVRLPNGSTLNVGTNIVHGRWG